MSELKIGDMVKVLHCGLSDGTVPEGSIGTIVSITRSRIDHPIKVRGNDGREEIFSENELELTGGTMKIGGILDCGYAITRKVMAVLDQGVELFGLSKADNHTTFDGFYTQSELDKLDWKLKTEPQLTEKTVAEIENELGLPEGSLRIKKED